MAGRVQDAAACATNAVESARERGERGFEAWALRLQAEIALAAQPPDVATAERRYSEAKALAGSLEMRPLCRIATSASANSSGQRARAASREPLTAAMTMYREMDMRLWLEQTESEMKLLT